jgi:phosphate uptake regulator
MKRKLIRQGVDGLTVYLPKKWTEKNSLKPGDEIELSENDNFILVSASDIKKEKKEISFKIEKGRETKRRIAIVNSYRAGYDKMNLYYDGSMKELQELSSTLLVGFELFKTDENTYSLESVAEPGYEDFEKLVQKMFYILSDILSDISSSDVPSKVTQVQKYDNLLKRMLSKNMLSVKDPFSFWHFLSIMTHTARQCYHMNKSISRKFNKREEELLLGAKEMFKMLQKIYLKRDLDLLFKLHDMEQEYVYKKGEAMLKNPDSLYTHYLIDICRQIYLTSSPLSSIIRFDS